MADEVDVENVLVGLIVSALYPNGTGNPVSVAGVQVKAFRGWPSEGLFKDATKNGYVLVSVATRNGVERNTSRYPMTEQDSVLPVHTTTAQVTNNIITLGGTVSLPSNVIVTIGQTGVYSYSVQSGDTLNAIASALATLIARDYPGASSNGPSITIGGTGKAIVCRIAGVGTVVQEVKRQEKSFQISIWSPPYPDTSKDADFYRYSVAKVIDPSLAALIRIVMPDNTYAHIHYERTVTMDAAQAEGLYRRDLFYWVEYATTLQKTASEIGVAVSTVQSSATPTGTLPVPDSAPSLTTNS